jgi:hypothetical protein
MDAVRCTRCGETRWSLSPRTMATSLALPCEACGGPTVPERRRPGAGRGVPPRERRRWTMGAAPGNGARTPAVR